MRVTHSLEVPTALQDKIIGRLHTEVIKSYVNDTKALRDLLFNLRARVTEIENKLSEEEVSHD